jgi:hypothetical protein
MNLKLFSFIFLMIFFAQLFAQIPNAKAIQRFDSVVEKDVSLKKSLPIYLNHHLGNVSIQGWVQDRIRVTLSYRVLAESQQQAQREFDKLSLITLETKDLFEMRVGHKQGVDLVSKMRDRTKNMVQVDLEVKAPYQSHLVVVVGDGASLKLDQWRGSVNVAGKNNTLLFTHLNLNQELDLNCLQCPTEVRDSRFAGRISIGSKPILLSGIESGGVFVDGANEEIRVEKSSGNFDFHTHSGRLNVFKFNGNLHLQSDDGGAFLSQMTGAVDIQTRSGQVMIDMEHVNHSIHVDTEKSDIQVSLPPQYEGAIDLMSLRGEVIVQFPYESRKDFNLVSYGPASPGRVDGLIGKKSEPVIHAYSKQGGVRLIRKAPSR